MLGLLFQQHKYEQAYEVLCFNVAVKPINPTFEYFNFYLDNFSYIIILALPGSDLCWYKFLEIFDIIDLELMVSEIS